jgi:putative transposase
VRDWAILLLHLLATIARLVGPGGTRAVVAESVLVKHQLLILNRSRQRSPNLCSLDRVIAALCACLIRPSRLIRSAVVFKPSTRSIPPAIGTSELDFGRASVPVRPRNAVHLATA